MEKQGRFGILFRRFKEHATLKSTFRIKASPGRGKLSPQVTDEGAGQQHFALNTPHPALRATCSPFCRYATFSPGAGEICPQGVKALAPDQAPKIDFHEHTKIGLDICAGTCYNIVRKCGHRTSASISAFQAEEVGSIPIARSIKKDAGSFRTSVFLYTLAPLLASLRILKVKKALAKSKKKRAGRLPSSSFPARFFLDPRYGKRGKSRFCDGNRRSFYSTLII